MTKYMNTLGLSAALLLCFVTPLSTAEEPTEADEAEVSIPADAPASAYIEFTDHLDGKCQILSNGGKLTKVENKHPEKKIRYRFTRVFAGTPQAGVARGVLEPGDTSVKLGCNKVDGKPQIWEIKVAEFVEEEKQ